MMKHRRLPLARALRQVAVGQVLAAQDRGAPLCVARSRNGIVAVMKDECPHDGGPLSDGFVEGERIVCSRHQYEFCLASGRREHPFREAAKDNDALANFRVVEATNNDNAR